MTPLAQSIARELALPIKQRSADVGGIRDRMDDIHCFDVSDVEELAEGMADDMLKTGIDADLMFLPAPKTWIEFVKVIEGRRFRIGYLLEARDGFCGAREAVSENGRWHSGANFVFELSGLPRLGGEAYREAVLNEIDPGFEYAEGKRRARFFRALLAIINTPRIIGRRQHMPHRGLERRLTQAMGLQGKFPLNAWTEILLQVTPPKDASNDPSVEAHLTGKRALHFCRAHLRIKMGRLELVKAHWRGDGSLGIKQSRYKVAA